MTLNEFFDNAITKFESNIIDALFCFIQNDRELMKEYLDLVASTRDLGKVNRGIASQPSVIHIYNIQGYLIKTIPVGPHFDKVNLDASSFSRGVYTYECDGIINRFILE